MRHAGPEGDGPSAPRLELGPDSARPPRVPRRRASRDDGRPDSRPRVRRNAGLDDGGDDAAKRIGDGPSAAPAAAGFLCVWRSPTAPPRAAPAAAAAAAAGVVFPFPASSCSIRLPVPAATRSCVVHTLWPPHPAALDWESQPPDSSQQSAASSTTSTAWILLRLCSQLPTAAGGQRPRPFVVPCVHV